MKERKISLLSLALAGTGIGFPVTAICATAIGGWNQATAELVIWVIASALFGIISGLIFGKSSLNLPAAIALHCLCCLIVALTAAMLCGYADNFLSLVIGVVPVFIVVYVLVYVFTYISMKREAKKINDNLSKK